MKQAVPDVFGVVPLSAPVIPVPPMEAYNPLLQKWQATNIHTSS
jgi:hypothetical protein